MSSETATPAQSRLSAMVHSRITRAASWAALGVCLIAATDFVAQDPYAHMPSWAMRSMLIADFIYFLVVVFFVIRAILKLVSLRRRNSIGSQLHVRLSRAFAVMALIPTVMVAIFAILTLNFGVDEWFSSSVRDVVDSASSASSTYKEDQLRDLEQDLSFMAFNLNRVKQRNVFIDDGTLRLRLSEIQGLVQRGMKEAFLVDGAGELKLRGEGSYLFGFDQPSSEQMNNALDNGVVIIEDWSNDEYRALRKLSAFPDLYLYVTRAVDGSILSLIDETAETAQTYQALDAEKSELFSFYGLIYGSFALIVLLAAIWAGIQFAERLSRPVGRLAAAATRVGAGDLEARVVVDGRDDEIAVLSRVFNKMTDQVKAQRDDLIAANTTSERERRLFDSVLSGVTAGVVGLDGKGKLAFVNVAAVELLSIDAKGDIGRDVALVIPEFQPLFQELQRKADRAVQREIHLTREGKAEVLLVRMAPRLTKRGRIEGYVVSFDDVTNLVSAQRMAAWGDVARRIAHEIKNPLTPIQLSAERLKRKYAPMLDEEGEGLTQYSDVIIRQTEDLRRIVDEFSKFARMPEPDRKRGDICKLLSDNASLMDNNAYKIPVSLTLPDQEVFIHIDETMFGQAITNLIKNALEAVDTKQKNYVPAGYKPEVKVSLTLLKQDVEIAISDNGTGLPKERRSRLFEPYYTNREGGTGLGLSIVKKIIEQHDGTLDLVDASTFGNTDHAGAKAVIALPRTDINEKEARKG